MDDAGRGRHHPEVVERLLAPLEELVPLPVPLEFAFAVDAQRKRRVELVHLDGVVDHEVALHLGVDQVRRRLVAGHPHDGGAHGGEVDDGGHPGEVLQDDPRRAEGDLGLADLRGVVAGECLDVGVGDGGAVVPAEGCFEQHLDRVRDRIDVSAVGERRDAEHLASS